MNEAYLKSIGKIVTAKDVPADIIENDIIHEIVASMYALFTQSGPKSILITGDKGVGKSTLIHLIAKRLMAHGWFIFSATAGNMMAGQRYIGDLEQSIQHVITALTGKKKNLWIVPRFQELYYGGRHEYSPVSILDQILPFVESGELRMMGEVDASGLEKVIQYRPQILSIFEIVRIYPSTKQFTFNLAKEWISKDDAHGLWSNFPEKDLNEIYYLSNQYLSYTENPGGLMDLLKQTKKLVQSKNKAHPGIQLTDFIDTLSNITGLPKNILDDGEKLDLENLKLHFSKKVIGQDDAVNTVIERIAMIKAGLTDPTKPAGVFLFVGPTGTGKTEIAKSVAEYLFGSEERLIRLDMSEFQTQESMYKILGNASDVAESAALVNRIRKNPFSIVLLDEFEKAHPNIWDLFLQVFDDGRLTDQQGSVADFRHAIIILTSNLGASMPTSSRIGFNSTDEVDIDANVLKSIHQTFRPEFVNRIDKIVVFNPLTKSVAKQILKNELKKILKRRGLRRRAWELDFDESALEFLLEKGFSSTLGARPLKRAIEKYLLAPLAVTIVNHNFPQGDQFLLVSTGKQKLNVEFIDPDEPDFSWEQKKQILQNQEIKSEGLELGNILLDTRGVLSEFRLIQRKLTELRDLISNKNLSATKRDLLQEMASNEFWTSPHRYEILSEIEFIDRFESGYETANNLLERLNNPEKERLSYDTKLINKLAERVYLLNVAIDSYSKDEPQDAILKIEYKKTAEVYGNKLQHMYTSWAKSRGMKIKEIKAFADAAESYVIYTLIGFGAYGILSRETGYHIFEQQEAEEAEKSKSRIKVAVIPMVLEDYRSKDVSPILERFRQLNISKNVRRYKIGKSPLVKDLRSNWQTGKIERVLNGDFDLFQKLGNA